MWMRTQKVSTFSKLRNRYYVHQVYDLKCDHCGDFFSRTSREMEKGNLHTNHFCTRCGRSVIGKYFKGRPHKRKLGATSLDSRGYVVVTVPWDKAKHKGQIREHTKVMEEHLGRSLRTNEVVHHIDGDKTNNLLENLDLCTRKEHSSAHATAAEVVFYLYKSGKVEYDRTTKRYKLR